MTRSWDKQKFAALFREFPYGWTRIREGMGWSKEQMIEFGTEEREFVAEIKERILEDVHTTFWCAALGRDVPEGYEKASPRMLEKILLTHSPMWQAARLAQAKNKHEEVEDAIDVTERRKLEEYLKGGKNER